MHTLNLTTVKFEQNCKVKPYRVGTLIKARISKKRVLTQYDRARKRLLYEPSCLTKQTEKTNYKHKGPTKLRATPPKTFSTVTQHAAVTVTPGSRHVSSVYFTCDRALSLMLFLALGPLCASTSLIFGGSGGGNSSGIMGIGQNSIVLNPIGNPSRAEKACTSYCCCVMCFISCPMTGGGQEQRHSSKLSSEHHRDHINTTNTAA